MRQRVMIAMALANNPDVLIADEPTTALDVTIQAQIIELIDRLKDEFNSAVILITTTWASSPRSPTSCSSCTPGASSSEGRRQVFYDPQMPYTWGLLGSIPRLDRPKAERLHSIKGSPPSLINLPQGCKFRPVPARVREVLGGARAREPRRGTGAPRPLLAARRGEALLRARRSAGRSRA